MARQRIHNSRSGTGAGNAGASWISYSDLMCALLLMFVLMLCVILYQYFTMMETKTAELDEQKALISVQQSQLDAQTLQIASQQVTMDHQNAQIIVIQTTLEEKEQQLITLESSLANQKNQLIILQGKLDDKETELSTMATNLANKEIALQAAIEALNAKQQALNSQTDKIEDMVGMRTQIISDLSTSLSRANLSAAVDPNTGDIVLDSAVLFKTNSSDIMSDGQYLLNRFIPVYLEVLLRPEYSDYLGEIIIEGHTDDQGTYLNNLKLSQNRALEVAEYVLSMYPEGSEKRKMLEQILTATGRSESDLIYYPGTTVVNQDASRRVEFKFSLKDAEMIEEMNRLLKGE
ncbi:MAG: OmpA family protein [Clostridia bacterium]|nr:OmpA family protein [Clostridia bacterium]